jgi:hypothetical protein
MSAHELSGQELSTRKWAPKIERLSFIVAQIHDLGIHRTQQVVGRSAPSNA